MEMPKEEEEEEIIFRSKLPDIYIPNHLPLHTYCFENITQFSSRPCLIDGATGETYTYANVELTARKVAAGLHKMGIEQGQVIMLLLPNSPEFVFAFLGALFRGAITTTANPFFTPPEIAKQARSSKAKLIITKACYAEKVMEFAREKGDVRVVCTDSPAPEGCLDFFELAKANENDLPAVEVQPEDVVVLPYSSGTTGLPKGVMLTHKSLVTSIAQQVEGENPNQYLEMDDVILCVLPLFHIYCLNLVLLCAFRARATLLIIPKFEINALLEVVHKYKVTIAPLVPPILLQIAKSPVVGNYDLSSVRRVISGAAPMGKDLEDAVRSKLPDATIGQGYGMTETALSMCLAFAKEPFKTKSGSCGTVLRNAEMKIVNPDTGVSLPRNQAGEICIRGDHIMKGYLDDPEATERMIDKERWLHTGDIGYVDDDDELFIVDRLKELIKYKGFQVAPAELEALLIAHPGISDVAIVPMKDETAGELPVAFVVTENGSEITEDEIKQYISKQVVYYKRIHRVLFTDTIPKAPSGKILRKGLREMLVAGFPN